MTEQTIKSVLPLKSVAGTLLFTVFLGPVGLLYASVTGGVVMLALAFIMACNKFINLFAFVWIMSSVWGVAATNRYNKNLL